MFHKIDGKSIAQPAKMQKRVEYSIVIVRNDFYKVDEIRREQSVNL